MTKRRWQRTIIECPHCHNTEDGRIRKRDDGGNDFYCKACGYVCILDKAPKAPDDERGWVE